MVPTKYPKYYVDGESVFRKRADGSFHKMSAYIDNVGYFQLKLRVDKKIRCVRLHRILAETLIPNPDNLPQVNHKDGNKLNNKLDNLEWCTNSYNTQAEYDAGIYPEHRRQALKVIDITTGKEHEYCSIREASKELGINRKTLTAYIKGLKTSTKYTIECI